MSPLPSLTRDPVSAPRSANSDALAGEIIELLIQRGDRFLAARDVIAARSFYERAAAAGSASAAFALARTFDAQFLAQIGATGVRPDAERAAAWYRVANEAAKGVADVPPAVTARQPAARD